MRVTFVVPKPEPIAPLDCGPGFALNPTTEQCEAVESTPIEPEPDNGGNDGASGGDGSDDGDNGGGDA